MADHFVRAPHLNDKELRDRLEPLDYGEDLKDALTAAVQHGHRLMSEIRVHPVGDTNAQYKAWCGYVSTLLKGRVRTPIWWGLKLSLETTVRLKRWRRRRTSSD